MSLKAFEQAWLEILLNPAMRQAWLAGDKRFHQLNPQELAILQACSRESLISRSHQLHRQRQQVLEAALPSRIRQLLGHSHSQALIAHLLEQGSPPPLYPYRQLLTSLMDACFDYLGQQQVTVPHLRDLVSYELASAHLDFFALPRPLPLTPGPRLAAWARLLRLGCQFPLLLESLNQGEEPPPLAEVPRQLFLLTREFRGLRLEALPPLVASCLENCDGQKSWAELVAQLHTQQAIPDNEAEALQAGYERLLQRGVLQKSTGADGI